MEYWLITYSWVGSGDRVFTHEVWKGTIMDWMKVAIEQPEEYVLLNQACLTFEEYEQYRFMF